MKMLKNEKLGKRLTIRLLFKALLVIFIVFTQFSCSMSVNKREKSAEEDLLKRLQIQNITQKADAFFERQQYTAPKNANAYDLYQEVLKIEPSNQYALKKIHDIFNALLDSLYKETLNKFQPAMQDEVKHGKLNNKRVVPILENMLNILDELKKICDAYPKKDSEIEEECTFIKDKINEYKIILSGRKDNK